LKGFILILASADQGFSNAKDFLDKIFQGYCDRDLFRVATEYLASEWPRTNVRLNPSCRFIILEFFFVINSIRDRVIIPREIIIEMTRWLILVWYDKFRNWNLLKNQNNKPKEEEGQNETERIT